MNYNFEQELKELIYGELSKSTKQEVRPNFISRKDICMPPKSMNPCFEELFITPVKTRATTILTKRTVETQIKKVIYHDPATIVYWEDGTKTVVKAMDGDAFDPERGLLQAYFEKNSGLSRTQSNKFIKKVVKENYTDKLEV